MALFNDGPACSITDLVNEDSGLLETAQQIGINVTAKLAAAADEMQSEIEAWLRRPRSTGALPLLSQPVIGQVVVTRELARWQKMLALTLVYRDAYFSQLVDRYKGKWDEYAQLTRFARDQFVAAGVGIVSKPLSKAAIPTLASVSSAQSTPAVTYYAAVTWVNDTGQEGAPSDAGSLAVPGGSLLTVSAVQPPAAAVGFNIYVGVALTAIQLVNQTPLLPGAIFTYVPGAVTGGRATGTGQTPDYTMELPRTLMRG